MRTSILRIFLFIFFLIQVSLISQTVRLNISVTDSSEHAVSDATVYIKESNLSGLTDDAGKYSFNNVAPGNYTLKILLAGYKEMSLPLKITTDTTLKVILDQTQFKTETIEVTSTFKKSENTETPVSFSEFNAKKLLANNEQNLAKSIENIPGVNNISTGSSIGKPVIRGLSSQGVTVIYDGVKQETQQWGDEHGPELDLFDIQSIEILRGPSGIKYGSDAIAGAINIIPEPLSFSKNKKIIFLGETSFNAYSVNKGLSGNLSLAAASRVLSLKGAYSLRSTGNILTPDGSLTVQTLSGSRIITGGELFNSAESGSELSLRLGYKLPFGSFNASYQSFLHNIQIHEDPSEDPFAEPNQVVLTSQLALNSNISLSKVFTLVPSFSLQANDRKEFGTVNDKTIDNPALFLKLKNYNSEVVLKNELSNSFSGSFGASFSYQKNSSLAEEKLIPGFNAYTFGLYFFEKYNKEKFSISAGTRFDLKKLNVERTVFEYDSTGNPSKVIGAQILNFNAVTGSVGATYNILHGLEIFSNLGRGWRPPSEFELFVDGVHEGAGRYEHGLRTLSPLSNPMPELSFSIDGGVKYRSDKITAELTFYRNKIDNFIYPSPTDSSIGGFPVFNVKQSQAELKGYEYNIDYNPFEWLCFSLSGDYVKTKNEATGNPLPFTPPMKNIFEVKFQKTQMGKFSNPYIKVGTKIVSAQNDVDPLETKTAGYTLLNAGLGFDFVISKSVASVDFSVDNIANTKYVDHLSRYRGYAMNPGRSFNLQVSVPFKF